MPPSKSFSPTLPIHIPSHLFREFAFVPSESSVSFFSMTPFPIAPRLTSDRIIVRSPPPFHPFSSLYRRRTGRLLVGDRPLQESQVFTCGTFFHSAQHGELLFLRSLRRLRVLFFSICSFFRQVMFFWTAMAPTVPFRILYHFDSLFHPFFFFSRCL